MQRSMRVKVRFGTKVRRNIAAHPWLYILAVPVLAYFIVFHYAPMYGVVIAFKNYKPTLGILGSDWVGLKHFESFVSGLYFERLLRNTISINLGRLIFGFPLPILFTLLVNELRSNAFRRVTQTIAYMPHFVSSMVVCGLLVQFTKTNGLLTTLLSWFGVEKTNLLSVPEYFQPLYIGMNIWQELGWDSIIFFAALTSVDPALYEAAYMDGAGRWRQMWHISLPGISSTIVILLIMRIGNLMSLGWDKIILLYNERVYKTADVISTYVYRRGLVEFDYSFGAAVGLMNSAVNILLLLGANLISRRLNETSLW